MDKMREPIFTGSCVAVVTPFADDFVNYEKLGELIDFQIERGTDAILVCGTTGEASTQSIPEHLHAIEYAVKHAAGRTKIIAGTGSNDTAHALKMSQAAEISGADGLLLVTPYYNKATQKGLIEHYTYIADRVGIPMILYNVPSRTGCSISVDTYKALSKHPNIVGTKEASSNMADVARTLDACGDDFYVWSGNDSDIVPIMALGGKGIISVIANIWPEQIAKIAHLCLEGNYAEAAKLQADIMELNDALFCEVNPIPVKTAMNLMGMDVGGLRMPLCDMGEKNLEVLKKALKKHDLI